MTIDVSPETYPWQGIAAHGSTPFSCMLVTQIEGNLWMGGCIDGLKLSDDFDYVLSLYPWEKYRLGPNTVRFEITAYDAEVGEDDWIWQAVDKGVEYVKQGKTLIHCQAGLNRSGLVTALVLNKAFGYSLPEAIEILRDRRTTGVLCNQHFVDYLHEIHLAESA